MSLPSHLRQTIESVLGSHIFRVTREDALMQAATQVLDAQQERDRLKLLLEAVRGELKTLAAIQMSQRGVSRLVLTRKEFDAVDEESEIHIEAPEPGVRIYEMRRKAIKGVVLNG